MNKGGFSALTAKLRGNKAFALALIGVCAGVALLLLPSQSGGEEAQAEVSAFSARDYCAELEQKAELLIKELPEVKDCRVVITLAEGYRYVYATDQHLKEDGGDGRAKQSDKTVVLAGSDGGETPLIVSETMPAVAGVAVVIRGAGYETKYRVIELMCALFDIKSNRISVQG